MLLALEDNCDSSERESSFIKHNLNKVKLKLEDSTTKTVEWREKYDNLEGIYNSSIQEMRQEQNSLRDALQAAIDQGISRVNEMEMMQSELQRKDQTDMSLKAHVQIFESSLQKERAKLEESKESLKRSTCRAEELPEKYDALENSYAEIERKAGSTGNANVELQQQMAEAESSIKELRNKMMCGASELENITAAKERAVQEANSRKIEVVDKSVALEDFNKFFESLKASARRKLEDAENRQFSLEEPLREALEEARSSSATKRRLECH